jgi:AcrR family transcriptional regulator
MDDRTKAPSAREAELLEAAYAYTLAHGLAELSLRPLASAIGSSPRVLLYLYGSKEGLVRALLQRARADELALLGAAQPGGASLGLGDALLAIWKWLAAGEHRSLLCLWVEAYGRALIEPDGPWGGFARQTVEDWLEVLAASQGPIRRRSAAGAAERTAALAVVRGALLDLLATGDSSRTSAAVEAYVNYMTPGSPRSRNAG